MMLLRALIVYVLCLCPIVASAGWVEDRVDPDTGERSTVIHVKFDLPEFYRTDAASRADVAVVKEFVSRFPDVFEERYRAKYEADPETYGEHDWSRVEVELHRQTGIKVETVETALLSIAGKVAPDILYVNFRQSDTYIQRGFLYPLDLEQDDYLSSMPEDEIAFRIHPKIWPVIERKGPAGEKHVWAVPYGGALGKVLLYRKDLFDEAGLDYPDASWTWDDFYDACRKITDPARGIYGVRFGRGQHEAWYWMTFLWSAGGEAVVYDEDADQWRAVFDSPEAVAALDFYTRLCTEPWVDEGGIQRRGYAYKDVADVDAKWTRGEIAMMFNYIDGKLFSQSNPEVTGMAPVPLGPKGIRGAELNSKMMGLFAEIDEPAVRDAAWEYIRFFDCREAVGIRTRVMVEGGLGRFINPRYLRMFGYDEIVRLAPKGWLEVFDIAMETGKPEPYGKNCNVAYNIMTKPLQEAEQMALHNELPEDDSERFAVMQSLLSRFNSEANEKMLGLIPSGERTKRNRAAFIVLLFILAAGTIVYRKASEAFKPPKEVTSNRGQWQFRRYWVAYTILIPAVLTILVWHYVPLGWGSIMAFQDYQLMGNSVWVGLNNFGDLLWDAAWWQSVWNSLRYTALVILLTFIPPVLLAILLQEVPRGKILFRTIYYIPGMLAGLVVFLLWKNFYEPSEYGALNAVVMKIPAWGFLGVGLVILALCSAVARRLHHHHMHRYALGMILLGIVAMYTSIRIALPIFEDPDVSLAEGLFLTLPSAFDWLGNRDTAMLSCVIPLLWAGIGPGCLIYLAALKGISDELYEAAELDGATFLDKILFVVFPYMRPLLIINFIGVFIAACNAEANILALTGGASNTEVAGLHIFYKAYIYLQFGPATAMAWVLGLLLIGFTVYQLRILSRLEFRTADETK